MQATAAIKIEVSQNTGSNKAKASSAEVSESFSNELDKHISTEQSKVETPKNVKNQTADTDSNRTEQAANSVEDGKKLPVEETPEHSDAVVEQTDNTSDKKAEVMTSVAQQSDDFVPNHEDNSETPKQAEPIVTKSAEQPVVQEIKNQPVKADNQPTDNQQATETEDVSPITEQKTVIADGHAVEHARSQVIHHEARQPDAQVKVEKQATKVVDDKVLQSNADNSEVEATVSTKQNEGEVKKTASETPPQVASPSLKPVAAETLKTNANVKSEVTNSEVKPNKLPEGLVVQAEKTPVSNTSKQALDAEIDVEDKPVAIRADIIEALNKKSKKGDTDLTSLKTKLSAQYQEVRSTEQQSVKSTLLSVPETKLEKPTALFFQPTTTPFSATTTGVSATGAGVTATALPSLDVQPSVQSASWSKVMVGRVVWMAKEGIQQAELKLNPANMGPVEVKLQVKNEQVSVSFQAQHAATRDAIEQALPRLRESFADSGIQLADTNVGSQMQQGQQGEQGDHNASPFLFSQVTTDDDDIETETEVAKDNPSGLSLYA